MQFMENLTDRQAAEAVRARIDWKYALGLELTDPGFDYSILSEFRQRLLEGNQEQILFDPLLQICRKKGLLAGHTRQRTDSTHVLAAIRALNLLELVIETMRRVLDDLAQVAPTWLQAQIQPEWGKRYLHRAEAYQLPKRQEEREALAVAVGKDGIALLQAIYNQEAPAAVKELPSVEVLRWVWIQQYYQDDEGPHWRTKKKWGQPPAGQMIASPDDLDAHYCVKRSTEWTGYKVHFTETCAPDHPHLITQVTTTPSTTHDVNLTQPIQAALIEKRLKPEQHLVDSGYLETDLLVDSQHQGIDLVGPMPKDNTWQARTPGAFKHTAFQIDWEKMQVKCPGEKVSSNWREGQTRRGTPNFQFVFALTDCLPCPWRAQCTRSDHVGRFLTVYPPEQYNALVKARTRQDTEAFQEIYDQRAGIEGTFSEAVRAFGLRRARYRGLAKTKLQHLATAASINILRIIQWSLGFRPLSHRQSSFAALMGQI